MFTLKFVEEIAPLIAAIAVGIAIFILLMPLIERDTLKRRMSSVATERKRMRDDRQAQFSRRDLMVAGDVDERLKNLAHKVKAERLIDVDKTKERLMMAGFRNEAPYYLFQLTKLCLPVVLPVLGYVYFLVFEDTSKWGLLQYISIVFVFSIIGWFLPDLVLKGRIQERQKSIDRAFPEAMDLLLICVGSGMSAEAAFRKVSDEIGLQSIPLAEELKILTAELSYLNDRRQAFDNLARRTGLDSVKAVVTALVQTEKYGTSLGQTLKVLAQENRDMRMATAEKKAAALPPKLTVPMVLFTLPVLFAIIMTPAMIQVLNIK